MSNKIYGRKLGRGQGARKALFRSLVRAMVLTGSIKTTKTKAKTYQKSIDKLITIAKKDTLASRRRVNSKLGNDREIVEKLYKNILPSLKDVKSGFIKRVNLKRRRGDNAEIVKLEWLVKEVVAKKTATGKKVTKSTGIKSIRSKISRKK